MSKNFDDMVKNIEDEILALKTASKYSSIRSANYSSSTMVRTGLYRITYRNTGEPIFSLILVGRNEVEWGIVYSRTPINNTQVVEVNSDKRDSQGEIRPISIPITVLSNIPVTSITRI